jgi:hypothetical protein
MGTVRETVKKGGKTMSAMMFDNALVTSMIEEAIAFCVEKMGAKTREEVVNAISNGDCAACDYLKYSLAKKVGECLGSMDETVKAIYIYEPEYGSGVDNFLDHSLGLKSGINLVAWVERKTAALSSVIASLNDALVEACKRLSTSGNGLRYLLDVKLADDNEVTNRLGYGALVHSIYVRPTEVWSR